MRRRIALTVGVSAIVVGTLTGCSSYPNSNDPNTDGTDRLTSATVKLPSGKYVDCVYGYQGGGVTCDFENERDTRSDN